MSLMINLRPLRKGKNLSQEQLGEALGVGQNYISQVEQGKMTPSLPMALKIADYFEVSLQDIIVSGDSAPDEPAAEAANA